MTAHVRYGRDPEIFMAGARVAAHAAAHAESAESRPVSEPAAPSLSGGGFLRRLLRANNGAGLSTIVSASLVVLFVVIIVDAVYINSGQLQNTISSKLRVWNASLGGLLALMWAALWIHLFVRLPKQWSVPAVVVDYNMATG